MKTNIIGRAWQPKLIIVTSIIAVLWIVSRFHGPIMPFWAWLDEHAFFMLNGTLEWGGGWTYFWGHMNTRFFDVIWAVIMGLPVLWIMLFDRHWEPVERLARGLVIMFSVLIGIFVAKSVGGEIVSYSPSIKLQPFLDVNQMVDGLKAKTGSDDSFPGDHGVAGLVYLLSFILFVRRPGMVLLALVIAIANTAPRLIGGGHWLSDVLVGAFGFSLLVYPWLVGAPVLSWAEKAAAPMYRFFVGPVLNFVGYNR